MTKQTAKVQSPKETNSLQQQKLTFWNSVTNESSRDSSTMDAKPSNHANASTRVDENTGNLHTNSQATSGPSRTEPTKRTG